MYSKCIPAIAGLGDVPAGTPDPSTATKYSQWAQLVQQEGGVPTNLPHGTGNVPAARYDASVWVPQVNAGVWPQPDDYSTDGSYAYYKAPLPVIADAQALGIATSTEVAAGAAQLEPEWFKAMMASLGTAGKWALFGAAAYLAFPYLRRAAERAASR